MFCRQLELDRANKEKEVVSSQNRHLEQRLTSGDSEHGDASELERLRSQVEVSGGHWSGVGRSHRSGGSRSHKRGHRLKSVEVTGRRGYGSVMTKIMDSNSCQFNHACIAHITVS